MPWKKIDTLPSDEKNFLVLCEGKIIDIGVLRKNGEVGTISGATPHYWLSYKDLPEMPQVPEISISGLVS